MPVGHLISSLDKCLLRSSVHFLIELFGFLLLSSMGSLRIWGISPLSDIWFGNIFSIQWVSFSSCWQSHVVLLFILVLLLLLWVSDSKTSLPRFVSKSLPLLSLSRSFMVSGFTFKYLFHFLLILGVWCKLEAQIYSFDWDCTIFPIPFSNKTVFSPLYILGSFAVN